MDPPAASLPAVASATHLAYPDSVESSPRSRNIDSWDDSLPQIPGGAKLRLMCSYGGHIVPRPHDKSLCYLGGETRIVVVERHSSLVELSDRLSRSLLNGRPFTLKYQLPNEDLDSLISVTTDEDLENMIEEYDRTTASSLKSSRLRVFLFLTKPETAASVGSLLTDAKAENWFLDALNGAGILPRGISAEASINCLLGLNHVIDPSTDGEAQSDSLGSNNKQVNKSGQDVQSVSDSPMMETNSSFGSTSSSPSMSNLPPIRVHVEDGGRLHDHKVGLEEHFSHLNVAAPHKQEEGVVPMASPQPVPTTGTPAAKVNPTTVASENYSRVFSDDERSDHGAPTGFQKPPQPQLQQRTMGVDLPSPDAAARDANSRLKPVFYQDPVAPAAAARDNRVPAIPVDPKANMADPSYRIQMQQHQQLQDAGYVLPSQLDTHQQQQFIPAGTHYIHHHATGPVPISSYYAMYPSAQHPQQIPHQLDQQYQMYFLPVRQTQAYNMPVQSHVGDTPTVPSSRPPTMPNPAIITSAAAAFKEPNGPVYPPRTATPPAIPESAANVYRTAATAAPSLIHMPSDQHQQQIFGYQPMHHHSSQSMAVPPNYAYEYADPALSQIYYTQPSASPLASQYQTMTGAAAAVVSEASTQLPTDNSKQQLQQQQQQQQQQKIRTSQPL